MRFSIRGSGTDRADIRDGGNAATLVDKKLGGYAANALGFLSPEGWYFTK